MSNGFFALYSNKVVLQAIHDAHARAKVALRITYFHDIISVGLSADAEAEATAAGRLTVVINGLRCAAVLNLVVPQEWCTQVSQVADTRPF